MTKQSGLSLLQREGAGEVRLEDVHRFPPAARAPCPAGGGMKFFLHVVDNYRELDRIKSRNLKNNVPSYLCAKRPPQNIQLNPKEGLLCAPSQASCCHVI